MLPVYYAGSLVYQAETEIGIFQEGGWIQKSKNIHCHGPKPMPNICHHSDPLLSQ
jgi:hypothetical protein